jgi:heme-degrading monooxygenase HmoA
MIARHWRGWTRPESADDYENFLKQHVLPGLKQIEGYRGGYILRSDEAGESQFVVINLFESLDAVRLFAGEDYSTAVFEPEAKIYLSRVETFATHYEVRACTVE